MACDEGLAERVRVLLAGECGVSEKKMFGGMAFMLRGNMAVGVINDDLMVRVGPEAHPALVREPHAREMDFTGKPMKGFVYVGSEGIASDFDLRRWVQRGVTFAATLPPK
jgi:TfoX/Sxy family transcriptional regulator of competence genes